MELPATLPELPELHGLFLGQPWAKAEPQLFPELLSDVTGLTTGQTKTRTIQMVLGLDSATVAEKGEAPAFS